MIRRRTVFPNTTNTAKLFRTKKSGIPTNRVVPKTETQKNKTKKKWKQYQQRQEINNRSKKSRKELEKQEYYLRENPTKTAEILAQNIEDGNKFDESLGNFRLIPQGSLSSNSSSSNSSSKNSSSSSSSLSNSSSSNTSRILTNNPLGFDEISLFELANRPNLIETINYIQPNPDKRDVDPRAKGTVKSIYEEYLKYSKRPLDDKVDDLRVNLLTILSQRLYNHFKIYIPELEKIYFIWALICYYFSVTHSNNRHCIRVLNSWLRGSSFNKLKLGTIKMQVRQSLLYLSSLSVIPNFNLLFMSLQGGRIKK
jgi:hypothetical protein